MFGCFASGGVASATLVNFNFGGLSATADFAYNVGSEQVTVKLTNTTTPFDAGTLLTGINFSFGGLTPTEAAGSWATGFQRDILAGGAFTDLGNNDITWSLNSQGSGTYQLIWNPPDNNDGIIGPFTNGSNYAGVNASLTNGSHNPVVAEVGTFILDVDGLTANTPLGVSAFFFGTGPTMYTGGISTAVPEPSAILFGALVCCVVGIGVAARRVLSRRVNSVIH
jgi:hypothetical protein